MLGWSMQAAKRPAGAEPRFIPNILRCCPVCGGRQRYDYKSSGRSIRRLDEFLFVEVQIAYCTNGRCPLVRKGMHPPEEWALSPAYERFGSDVIAACGLLHFVEKLGRDAIVSRLRTQYGVEMSPRTANRLFDLYGALVSGSHLDDPLLIRELQKQRVMVISLDGAEPIKGCDPVWFVRDVTSGLVLAAKAMSSCRGQDIAALLLQPVKEFAERHRIRIVGVVSDAEDNIRAAVRTTLPGVPHQLCQIHYVKNLAKPLKAADGSLHRELKKGARGLRQLERDIRAAADSPGDLDAQDAESLLDICTAIRSVLKDGGKLPFKPPGLKLFEQLIELQEALAEMAREKGGPS